MGFSPNIVGPSLSRAVPLKLPEAQAPSRRGIEYVRPGGFLSSWKTITAAIRHGSQPVAAQAGSAMISSIFVSFISMIGFSLRPPSSVAIPALSTMILGGILTYVGSRGFKKGREDIGIFALIKTVAGYAYEVKNSETGEVNQISSTDPVIELHINDKELAKRLKGVSKEEIPAAFGEILEGELAAEGERIKKIINESDAKAIRLWTDLNPKYFKGFESYEIQEVRLSEKTPEKPSWFSRVAARFIKRSSEFRFLQVLRNIAFRPVKRWFKTYPHRTYLIFREDLKDKIT